jgi:hypothetical protein
MLPENLPELWTSFCNEFQARGERLNREFSAAWKDLRSSLEALKAKSESLASGVAPPNLAALGILLGEDADAFLKEPLSAHLRARPAQRALSALQDYDNGLEDIVRPLPKRTIVTPAGLGSLTGERANSWAHKQWLRWRKRNLLLPARDLLWHEILKVRLTRCETDGEFQLVLARASVHLPGLWSIWSRHRLTQMISGDEGGPALRNDLRSWANTAGQLIDQGDRALVRCRAETAGAHARLPRALLRSTIFGLRRSWRKSLEKRQSCLEFWARQQRAVLTLLDLKTSLLEQARRSRDETVQSLDLLQNEHRALRLELDAAIEWLDEQGEPGTAGAFPATQASLSPASDRAANWEAALTAQARGSLPESCELAEPRSSLPGIEKPWRQVEPLRVFLEALRKWGRPAALAAFSEAENSGRIILRELERARQVVAYGSEEAEAGVTGIAEEAVHNARSLLVYQRDTLPDPAVACERLATQALATMLLETEAALEKSWLGILAHLTRQRGTRAARQLAHLALQALREFALAASTLLQKATREILIRAGWLTPPPVHREPVDRIPQLHTVLQVGLSTRGLPAIYRRLFRLAPVEDPRFLVGREREMAGLAEARARWDTSAGASVIVVGSRGSGKTSLLQCAAAELFKDVLLVTGSFRERLTSADHMREFLRGLIGVRDGVTLEEALAAGRRVIILEEFERTFLRRMNGFGALHEFLHIADSTSATTLWIVSINETAYEYLAAAARIAEHFPYRINAMSVREDALTGAILQRHNLSGLRLQFAPPLRGDPRLNRMTKLLGLVPPPQELFFQSLFSQSEGIFRSGFELWQDSIERVEGGVVHMRQPLDPDYRPLLLELNIEDRFSLQAILQHGGLTVEEISQVLRINYDKAQRRISRLVELEIIEAEPRDPGFRVRPQAGRLVREALHAHNLLPGAKS